MSRLLFFITTLFIATPSLASPISRENGVIKSEEVSSITQLVQAHSLKIKATNGQVASSVLVIGARNIISLGQNLLIDGGFATSLSGPKWEPAFSDSVKGPEVNLGWITAGYAIRRESYNYGIGIGVAFEKVNSPYINGDQSTDPDEDQTDLVLTRQRDKRPIANFWASYQPAWLTSATLEISTQYSQKRRSSHSTLNSSLFFQLSDTTLMGLSYFIWKAKTDTDNAPGFTATGPGFSFGYNIGD